MAARQVRTAGEDADEQKVIDDIARVGWHCVSIFVEGDLPPYAFTVGLQHTFDHPELIIFGLRSETAHEVLGIVVDAIRSGTPIDMTQPTDELLENYSCVFVPVPKSAYYEHVGYCGWFYRGDDFALQQIVWPNREGQFPWHPAASAAFRATQPVLGAPSAGA